MEDSERRKAIELLKEMREENNENDGKSSNQEPRLNWMYKGPADLVNREEYLLGKTIDKNFEVLNSAGSSDIIGRTGEQSNVPKRLLEKTNCTEQVDIAKKILEDPLYAIKQKEMEARKRLLNNPVKLKQIKQLLLERSRQNSAHKKKKKKLKKKSEQELNLLILKKLKKFTDKEKRKALSKIMKSDSSSSESSSDSREEKKEKKKRKRSSSSSDESDDSDSGETSSSSSDKNERKYKKRKKRQKKPRKKSKSKKSSSDSESSDEERKERPRNKRKPRKKQVRESSSSSDSDSSDDSKNDKKIKSKNDDSKLKSERKDSGSGRRRSRSNERDSKQGERKKERKRRDSSSEKSSSKTYGLMMPDGSKPEMKSKSPVKKYEKNIETKTKYIPPPKAKPLSEKEREEKLREMMIDAKQRKEDRERNLASHRKKEHQEEELKTYDDDFMRRQMSHLTSQGTMADRIKSNINNIQRSKSSMDSNFMRK